MYVQGYDTYALRPCIQCAFDVGDFAPVTYGCAHVQAKHTQRENYLHSDRLGKLFIRACCVRDTDTAARVAVRVSVCKCVEVSV